MTEATRSRINGRLDAMENRADRIAETLGRIEALVGLPGRSAVASTLSTDLIDQLEPEDADRVREVVEALPEELKDEGRRLAHEAQALAWLMVDHIERFRRLRTAVRYFAWRDVERAQGGATGDFLLAIEEEAGFRIVPEVCGGLERLLYESEVGTDDRSDVMVRRHAADHYRERGRPTILHGDEGGPSLEEAIRVLAEVGAGETGCDRCGVVMSFDNFVDHLPCTGPDSVVRLDGPELVAAIEAERAERRE